MTTTFSITRSSQDSYGFTISLSPAFGSETKVRWEIVPSGELPIAIPGLLSQTVTFSATETSKVINPALTPTNLHAFSRDFEIRLYKVVGQDDSASDETDDELLFTQPDEQLVTRATVVGEDLTLSGGEDKNVIGLGFTDIVRTASGGPNDDTFIVTRFQYSDVKIDDGSIDNDNPASLLNVIKFDYGVTITDYSEVSNVNPFTRVRSYESVTLTLDTGAEITISFPDGLYSYQLGDGQLLNYLQFKAAIGVTPTAASQGLEINDRNYADEFGQNHEIITETTSPVLSGTPTELDTQITMSGGSSEDIFTIARDVDVSVGGGGANDVLIISRFQYGDVTVDDGSGSENLVKFDYGITIKGYNEVSNVNPFTRVRSYESVTLTLDTDAEITIRFPSGLYNYQLGNGEALDYLGFKAAIGVTPTTASQGLEINDRNYADEFLNDYKIPFPPTTILFEVSPTDLDVDVAEDASSTDKLIELDATLIADNTASVSYSITAGNGAGLFRFGTGDDSNVIFLVSGNSLDFDVETPPVYTLTVQLSATPAGGTEAVTETVKVRFSVTGVDEHEPVLGDPAIVWEGAFDGGDNNDETARIEETAYTGTRVHIGTFMVSDADRGPNGGVLTYALTGGDGKFGIEQDGSIYLIAALDSSTATHSFTVTASDDGGTTTPISHTVAVTVTSGHGVIEDADVQYAYPEDKGVAHSITTSQQAEVELLTTAEDATSDAASVTEITQDRVDENGNTVTETIGYRATGTYGVFEYYLFGKGWKYTVNHDAAETIAKAGARISEDFVFEISPSGGATYKTTITANVASNFSYVETEGTLDVSDTTITDITILTTSGDAVLVRTDGDIVTASTSWGDLEFNTKTGAWVYTLNNDDPDFQEMKSADDPLTETFVVEISKNDGTTATENIVINVHGKDEDIYFIDADGNEVDTPPSSAEITTAFFSVPDPASISGTVNASTSAGDTATINTNGIYGTLVYDSAIHVWDYTLNHEHAAIKALAVGATLTDTITLAVTRNGVTTTETVTITIGLARQGIYFADENGDVITLARGKQYFAQDGFEDIYTTTSGGPFDITLDLNNPAVTSPNGLILGDVLPEIGGLIDIRSAQVAFADSVSADLKNIFYISSDGTLAINPIGTDAEVKTLLAGLGDSVTLDLVITAPRETAEELTYQVVVDVINGNSNVLATIPENAVGGTEVGRVKSFTEKGFFYPDEAGTATLTYSITAGNTGGVFAIGDDGVITLAPTATLDAETTASYTLSITATYDPDGNAATTDDTETHSFDVVINVGDVNEHDPAFAANAVAWQSDFTSGNIPENTKIGTHLATITASDADITKSLNYAITGGNDDDIFAINPHGRLTLNGALDYEDTTSYTLTVTAYDGNKTDADTKSSTTTVSITITNIAPEFGANPVAWAAGFANGIVAEDTYTNAPVTLGTIAAEAQGNTNPLTYTILGGNDDGIFSLTGAGALSLVKPLDAETTGEYLLTIQVSDGTAIPDTTTIAITVGDVNEHTPAAPTISWAADFTNGNVAENTESNTPLATVTATDADARADLQYNISGTGSDLFDIDNAGNLTLKGRLNFESTTTSYDLMITATDGTNTSPPTAITITVTDVAPEFGLNVVMWAAGFRDGVVAEDTYIRTPVTLGTIAADPQGNTNPLTYTIIGGNVDDTFSLTPAGALSLVKPLDAETIGKYFLTIQVSDGTTTPDTTIIAVTVDDVGDVDDVNRHEPTAPTITWAADFTGGNVAESTAIGTLLASASSTDGDGDETVTYSISGTGSNLFAIDPKTGAITLAQALNFETTTAPYTLTITASDGTKTATTDISITVGDVDPELIWAAGFADGIIAETAAEGAHIASFVQDTGSTATLRYAITAGNMGSVFSIDATTGAITLAGALDYDATPDYTLSVQVTDTATNAVITTTEVHIRVGGTEALWRDGFGYVDADNNPVVNVARVGADAAQVTILGSFSHNRFADDSTTYSIAGGNTHQFAIHNGYLHFFGNPGTQTPDTYTLTIIATDGILTDSTNIVINVANQNAPVFASQPVAWEAGFADNIQEDTAIGTLLGQVDASDADASTLSYYFVENNAITSSVGAFSIDADTGAISLTGGLDYETAPSHDLTIRVSDGFHTTDTDISIAVGDVDVEVHWLANFADGNVREEQGVAGTLLATINPDDMSANHGYRFIDGSQIFGAFRINDSGEILIREDLNYKDATSHRLDVKIIDTTTSETIAVVPPIIVNVVDAYPRLAVTPVRWTMTELSEATPIGTVFGQVDAADPDSRINYSFVQNGKAISSVGPFTIDRRDGTIKLSEYLDYDTASSYALTIRVTDGVNHRDTAPQTITITDAGSELIWVDEGTATNTVIGTIAPDNPNPAQTYRFVGGALVDGPFTVNANNGEISFTGAVLNYETTPAHALQVEVVENGAVTATLNVSIRVVDVNEAPTFSPAPVLLSGGGATSSIDVNENADIGTLLGRAYALDPEGDKLNYAFVENGALTSTVGAFTISLGGKITVSGDLNYESTTSHSLTIRARDSFDYDAKFADATATINVIDADTEIVWGRGFIGGNVGETTATNTQLATINHDTTATRTYEFVVGATTAQTDGAFTINANTGTITLTGALDYETAASHALTIRITDTTAGTQPEVIPITINVLNEIETTWEAGFANGAVSENTAFGTNLAYMTEGRGGVAYRIVGGDEEGLFVLDQDVEEIKDSLGKVIDRILHGANLALEGVLDYETKSTYILDIQLVKGDGEISTTQVTINVGDGNDAPKFGDSPITWSIGGTDYTERDESPAYEISAMPAAGATLGTITATDPNNDALTYRIIGDGYGGFDDEENPREKLFTIQNGNEIALTGALPIFPAIYRLTIEASDGTLTDTTDVVIRIGSNDGAPVFGASPVSWQQDFANGISENVGAGTVVALLNGVTDKESGDFVRFYFIDEDGAHTPRLGAFDIVLLGRDENGETVDNIAKYLKANPNSPVSINYAIRLNERVDYEAASILSDGTRGYKLKIGASDSFIAGTGNIAEATDIIEVRVHDIDDYVTWETGRGYANGNVEEKNSGIIGEVIGRVRADVDGDNDNLRFYFLENNVRTSKIEYRGEDTNNGTPTIGEIVIDDRTGEIMFRNINPDFENGPTTHNLVVEISLEDSSNQLIPKRTLDVTIDIVDVNERPAFTQSTYDFGTVLENAPLELSIGSVKANDIDAGDEVTYSIFSGNDNGLFEINPMTGEITVKSMLDYDATTASNNSHSLIVSATDGNIFSTGALFSTATVKIEVIEYTASTPDLTVTSTTPNIAEQETASTDAVSASGITISVTGGDPNRNDFIVTGDSRFDVVEVDGVWTLQLKPGEVLDYALENADSDPTITLTLQVNDGSNFGGTGRVSDTKQVTVTVLDRPDLELDVVNVAVDATTMEANHAFGEIFSVTDANNLANPHFAISVVSGTALDKDDFAVKTESGEWVLHYVGEQIAEADFLDPIIRLDVTVSSDAQNAPILETARVRLNLHDGSYLDFQDNSGNPAVYKVNQADDMRIEPVDLEDLSLLVGSNTIHLNDQYDGRTLDLSYGRDIYVIENDIKIGVDITIHDIAVESADSRVDIIRLGDNVKFASVAAGVGDFGGGFELESYTLTFDVENDAGVKQGEVKLHLDTLDLTYGGYQFQQGEFGEVLDFEDYAGEPIPTPDPGII